MAPDVWYCLKDDKTLGPFSFAQVQQLAAGGLLQRFDKVSSDAQEWVSAETVDGLFPFQPSLPVQQAPRQVPGPPSQKAGGLGQIVSDQVTYPRAWYHNGQYQGVLWGAIGAAVAWQLVMLVSLVTLGAGYWFSLVWWGVVALMLVGGGSIAGGQAGSWIAGTKTSDGISRRRKLLWVRALVTPAVFLCAFVSGMYVANVWGRSAYQEEKRRLAVTQELEGNLDQALTTCNEGLMAGETAELLNVRGGVYYIKGDYKRAESDLSTALILNPRMAETLSLRGRTYAALKKYSSAVQDYSAAMALNPRLGDPLLDLADRLLQQRDWDGAFAVYDAALKVQPKLIKALQGRGESWYHKGDLDKALEDFTAAINAALAERETPLGLSRAFRSRGLVFFRKGNYDAAIRDYAAAIERAGTSVNYTHRGDAYRFNKEYDKAIADYTQAIQIDADAVDAYFGRGCCYGQKREEDRAIADYTAVININPKLAAAYFNRGIHYQSKGEMAKAKADTDAARRLDPSLGEKQ